MNTIQEFEQQWQDKAESHRAIQDLFRQKADEDPFLKRHRDYIEKWCYGYGDRAMHYMWKLLVNDVLKSPQQQCRFLEVGVHCGQVLSLVEALMWHQNQLVVGVSTYDGSGDKDWPQQTQDYKKLVLDLFKVFNGGRQPIMVQGDSRRKGIIAKAAAFAPYQLVYIDGSHEHDTVLSDLNSYTPMLEVGGYLVCDDSCVNLDFPIGLFPGHKSVSDAVDELLPPKGPVELDGQLFEHVGNVSHDRIWRKPA